VQRAVRQSATGLILTDEPCEIGPLEAATKHRWPVTIAGLLLALGVSVTQ
jgi:hypothetical protein